MVFADMDLMNSTVRIKSTESLTEQAVPFHKVTQ